MKYNYKLNADNRVKATVYPADETLPVMDFPAEFKPENQNAWKIVDDTAVYDPEPEPTEPENEPEPTTDELAAGLAEVAEMSATNSASVDDIYTALAELAGMIGG